MVDRDLEPLLLIDLEPPLRHCSKDHRDPTLRGESGLQDWSRVVAGVVTVSNIQHSTDQSAANLCFPSGVNAE
jgi:hypothetical protein